MGITAEFLAQSQGISREEQDEFGFAVIRRRRQLRRRANSRRR